jgi:hypothetical protein
LPVNTRNLFRYIFTGIQQLKALPFENDYGKTINLIFEHEKCGCNVADSVEPEVWSHLRLGHYVDSVWICDDCFRQSMVSAADVSPNTPRADADVT